MRWLRSPLCAALASALSLSACDACGARTIAPPYPPPSPRELGDAGARLQRTMQKLADTSSAREPVRILFYGQSITRSVWTRDLADRLRLRFPHAEIVVENRAVGGFGADLLVRTAELDVYGFWPDLILLHDLFVKPEDFDTLIHAFASRTTAEIGIQTTHRRGEGRAGTRWDDTMSETYRATAARYGLELIDVRSEWTRYLDEHDLHPMALLQDEAGHLNGAGDALMAALVERHLRVIDGAPREAKGITDVPVAGDVRFDDDGRLTLPFTGTRVEALLDDTAGASARVLIDGRAPSTFPSAWTFSRPNGDDGADWPWEVATPIRVVAKTAPVVEEWTATLSGFDARFERFHFALAGSVTGPDGEGSSDVDFVSQSGRVVIDARDWWLGKAHEVKGRRFADGTTITFRALPLHVDVLAPGQRRVVLVSGLDDGEHTLVLERIGEGTLPLRALRISRPADARPTDARSANAR